MGVRRNGGQVFVERHDGVGHQLAGPMRRDVATTIRRDHLSTRCRRITDDVCWVSAPTERDGGGMLENEHVVPLASQQRSLKVIGLCVGDPSKMANLEAIHQSCAVQSERSSRSARRPRNAAA